MKTEQSFNTAPVVDQSPQILINFYKTDPRIKYNIEEGVAFNGSSPLPYFAFNSKTKSLKDFMTQSKINSCSGKIIYAEFNFDYPIVLEAIIFRI